MQNDLITLVVSFVLSFLMPELAKLSKWVQGDIDRKLILRLISALFAFVTAVVGVILGGDSAGLNEVLESLIIAAAAFFGAFVQHKLVKAVRQ